MLKLKLEELHAIGTAPKAVIVVSPTYFGTCSDVSGKAFHKVRQRCPV